jgi:hypothetical protein
MDLGPAFLVNPDPDRDPFETRTTVLNISKV